MTVGKPRSSNSTRRKRPDPYPKVCPVEVRWIDSMGSGGWGQHTDPALMEITSVGNLIARKKDRVVIALNRSHYSHGEVIEIPTCAVRRVRRLK